MISAPSAIADLELGGEEKSCVKDASRPKQNAYEMSFHFLTCLFTLPYSLFSMLIRFPRSFSRMRSPDNYARSTN